MSSRDAFLAADAARETLLKQQSGGDLSAEEQAFTDAASANPKHKSVLL
ncbi:hypothetical protein HV826_34460, partial [Myxococcus sp. AM010]|nr:hypothetical protein [Myxococcus sp. AM010]